MNTTQTITNPAPMAATVEEAARDVAKCLNERNGQGLDLRHVAMLVHHAHMSTFTPDVKTPSEPSPTAGMNMAQRILHVGGRNNAAGYVEFGSIQAVQALVLQFVRDMVRPPMRRVSDGWKTALQQIANWDSHDPMLGVDMGSNGVRDFYRQIARDALADAPTAPQGVPDGWQPIETAPESMDQCVVVGWLDDEGLPRTEFDYKEDGCWIKWHEHAEHTEVIGGHGVSYTPPYTHWLKLPPLASAPPEPQAAKCATCNGNGLIGGPSFYAPDEGGVPCPDCSQAAVVQQEPIGFISPKQVELIGDPECEFGKYIPMRKTPAGNFTLALYTHPAPQSEPIDMVLHCPACGLQHIDNPEPAVEHDGCTAPEFAPWDNPPHRSHLCHGCDHIWRPADVPTNGVQAVKTKGKADSPVAVPHNSWTKLHEACALAMEALEKERQFAHGKRDFSMLSVRAIEALREAFRDQTGG